jgi:hypothetical protein
MIKENKMKIIDIENSESVDITGTTKQGMIKTTYRRLVEVFGEPTIADRKRLDSATVCWQLLFKICLGEPLHEDVYASIYDRNVPCGMYDEEYDFTIGGLDSDAVDVVTQMIEGGTIDV